MPSRYYQRVAPWLRSCAIGAAALALLGACQTLRSSANPEVPLWVHRPSGSMELAYSRTILADSRDVGEPYERGQPELDIVNRRVFVGSRDWGLYALNAGDGSVLWRFETLGPSQSEPLYDSRENALYFGSNDGALYKVNADDGRLLWRFATNAEVARRPVLVKDVIYAVNANDTVIALNAKTGAMLWAQHRQPALGMEVAGYAGPLVWRGLVYSAFSDGTVTAFDATTGEERWAPVDLTALAEQGMEEQPTYLDVDTTPVPDVIDDQPVVFVASYEAGVYALSADVGSRVWGNDTVLGASELLLWQQPSYTPKGGGPPIPARKLLIVSTGTTGLWALDPVTGREIWRRPMPDGGASRAVPMMGTLMVSTTRQGLFIVSPLDGRIIDGIHTGDGFSMPPAVYGRRAYILSNHSRLLSIQVTPPT
ncbi:MAG: PQQ-binding-like beta-propeller repeat protein [Polyangiaceae bacterium]